MANKSKTIKTVLSLVEGAVMVAVAQILSYLNELSDQLDQLKNGCK